MLLKVLLPVYLLVIFSVVQNSLAAKTSRLMKQVDSLEKRLAILEDTVRHESEYHREDIFDIQTQLDEIKAGNVSGVETFKADLMDKTGETLSEFNVVALLKEVLGWQVAIARAFQEKKKINAELRNEISELHQDLENVKASVEQIVDTNRGIKTELAEQADVMRTEISGLDNSIKSAVTKLQADVHRNLTTVDNTLDLLEGKVDKCGELNNELNKTVLDNKRHITHLNETSFERRKVENETIKAIEETKLKSCNEAPASGTVTIYPPSFPNGIRVYCEKVADTNRSYLVFHRRQDGSVSFQRNYSDFVSGFGELDGEFWLGLETVHKLTTSDDYELRVDLMDFERNEVYAEYSPFSIGPADFQYKMSLGRYSGTAGDSMAFNNENPFTGPANTGNLCAASWGSSWWFARCSYANLNGYYFSEPRKAPPHHFIWQGIRWDGFKESYSMKFAEMKIRLK